MGSTVASVVGGTVEKLRDWFSRRSALAVQSYNQAVRCAANGEKLDIAKLAAVLQDAAKTPEDFNRDVEKCLRRAGLRADLKKAEALGQERKKNDAAADAAANDLAAAQRKYEETVGPLQERSRQLHILEQAADAARRELLSGCEDTALLAEKEDLHRRRFEASERRQALDCSIRAGDEQLGGLLAAANRSDPGSNLQEKRAEAQEKQAQVEQLGREIAEARAELSKLDKELAELQREAEALDERLIWAP